MAELRTHRDLSERGESAIAGALLALGQAFIVLPHLILPGRTWPEAQDDLDVVVLGPGGLVLLGYHHWQGMVEAAAAPTWRLRFPGGGAEERANPASVLDDKLHALVSYLADHGAPPAVFMACLVFPERTRVDGDAGIAVSDTSRIADWITAHVGTGDPAWPRLAADQIRPASPVRLVNQYQLTSVVKRHADSTTYLAYDTIRNCPVFLRELPYDPYQQEDHLEKVRQELLREAKLTMELDHLNVVRVERVIPKDDRYYVVAEWIDSCQTLRERLDQAAPLQADEALSTAIQAAAALSHAHGKGIIHRDVRPENILVAPGTVKLTNFGLAKKADLGTRPTFDLRKMATESPYAAPELRLGQEGHHQADARSDVFSLGVVLYEMLTGQLPGHLDEKYWEPPSQFVRDLPPGLDDVLSKALRFDPAQRFSTMNAFRERLMAVRDHMPDHSDSPRQRYVDRRLLKRTRNSLIYQATDRKLMREVALKKVLLDPALGPDSRKAQLEGILREAAIASRIIHPGVVHVLDHFIEDDDGYIVMEWLPGVSLRELLDKSGGQLPIDQALDLVTQVGEAVHFAHGLGIIHRDIKPENVMVNGTRATLLDFGIASAPGFSGSEETRSAGTARYIAPEVLRGRDVDERSDVFSLGVMAYELLTGRYPYSPQTIMSRYDTGLLTEGIAAPSALNLEVSAAMSAAVMQALACNPAERYPTMEAFLEAISAARGRGRPVGAKARMGLWIGLGIAGLAVAAIGSLFALSPFFSRSPKQPTALLESPAATDSALAPESASQAVALVASAAATPEAQLFASPTPLPATPEPTAPPVSWASAPDTMGGVTVEVVSIKARQGRSEVRLRIRNDTADAVKFLDQEGLVLVADSQGADYSASVDYSSVDDLLKEVRGGQEVEGTFTFRHGLDPGIDAVTLVVKEDGGAGRIFNLVANRKGS